MDNQAAGPDVSVCVVCEECVRAVTLNSDTTMTMTERENFVSCRN